MLEGTERERERKGEEERGGNPRVTRQETERGTDKHLCMAGENEREADREQKHRPKENQLNKGSLEKQTKKHLEIYT